MYECIIIGGGISGISFAHRLKRAGRDVLVLEKEAEIGGQIQTRYSSVHPDFWMELGAHTCYNTYTRLLSMVDELEAETDVLALKRHSYQLYTGGNIRKIQSEIAFPSLFLHGPRLFFSSKVGKTVREYFRPVVGGPNYDRLFSKAFRAVISQNADDYPAEVFLKKRKERRKDQPRKFSFTEGLGSFLHTVVTKDRLEVRTREEVLDVKKEDGVYLVTTSAGEVLSARTVAFATPANVTARFIRQLEPLTADYLKTISIFRSETLNIVVRKERIALPGVAGILPVSDDFLSVVSRDVTEHPEVRSFTLHLEGHRKTDNEKRDLLCRILSIRPEDVLESVSTTHELPSLRLPHVPLIREVERLRTQEDLFLLGNYYYGLSLEDCVHRSFDEAGRFLQTQE